VVAELLDQRWSPQQVGRHLRVKLGRAAGDVVVSCEYLSAEIGVAAAIAAGFAPSLSAAYQTRVTGCCATTSLRALT
jgi:hypothetical protein